MEQYFLIGAVASAPVMLTIAVVTAYRRHLRKKEAKLSKRRKDKILL